MDRDELARVRQELTVRSWTMPAYIGAQPAYEDFSVWLETTNGYMGVPRYYGHKLMDRLGWHNDAIDCKTEGQPVQFDSTIELWDGQVSFVDAMTHSASTVGDFVATRYTGGGKTVCCLETVARLGRAALVVVDQENLLRQWQAAATRFLNLSENDIGIIQGEYCEVEGRKFVIAMIQTLVRRRYPDWVYQYFGVVIFDEVHTASAPVFSRALFQFPARVRFGVTATPRDDAFRRITELHLGPVVVQSEQRHLESYVRYVEYFGVYSWYANQSPHSTPLLAEIVSEGARNNLLSEIICRLYQQGRDILVVSDRIEQLENLAALCYYRGMDEQAIGMYTGYRLVWGIGEDGRPVLQKLKRGNLEQVKAQAKVIFATYSLCAKGVDIPRLSAGIDCTPRSRSEQVHGRILRCQPGKQTPVWVTVRDVNSYRAEMLFLKRLKGYVQSNARIQQWHLKKGFKKYDPGFVKDSVEQRVRRLRSQKIIIRLDGNYTLVMEPTGKPSKRGPGIIIGGRSKKRKVRV